VRHDAAVAKYSDRDLVRVFADENLATFDFLVKNGVQFHDRPMVGPVACGDGGKVGGRRRSEVLGGDHVRYQARRDPRRIRRGDRTRMPGRDALSRETTALYWTSIELAAPAREGPHTWSVEFGPREPDLPHERGSTTFSVLVVRPPEHRPRKTLRRRLRMPKCGSVRIRPPRTGWDLRRPTCPRASMTSTVGYEAPTTTVRLEENMLVEVEVLSVPEEDADAAWLM
jgi:hypothetical protein